MWPRSATGVVTYESKCRSLTPAKDILLELFEGGETELGGFLLRHTYFLSPDRIRERYEKTKSAAWFPDCVRGSRQYHKGKENKDQSVWEGRTVKVCDNTKARLAFAPVLRPLDGRRQRKAGFVVTMSPISGNWFMTRSVLRQVGISA